MEIILILKKGCKIVDFSQRIAEITVTNHQIVFRLDALALSVIATAT